MLSGGCANLMETPLDLMKTDEKAMMMYSSLSFEEKRKFIEIFYKNLY